MPRPSTGDSLNLFRRFAEEGFARLVSDLGNPLFMPPIVLIAVAFLLGQPVFSIAKVFGIAVVCYTILPFALTIYLLKQGIIESVDLPIRNSRHALYGFSILTAGAAVYGIHGFVGYADPFLLILPIVFLINLAIAFLLNLKWKISVHTASVAVAGSIYGYLYFFGTPEYPLITIILSLFHLLLLLPIMVWGRYHLEAHSAGELIGGSSSGILLTVAEIIIIQYLW